MQSAWDAVQSALQNLSTRCLLRVHRDQRGSISIVTVFTLLMFTILLVMLVNIGTHVDDKLKMQNAADASTYSGGLVLARGMNGIAFGNHLLCDVFAMTAFLRESRDRNAEQQVPTILEAWRRTGELLQNSQFEKFRTLGIAIVDKVPKEQEAVTAFGEMSSEAAKLTLPVFEYILSERLIGRFQRDLLETVPVISQQVTNEVARRHGLLGPSDDDGASPLASRYEQQRGAQFGVLWKTIVQPVALGDEVTPQNRTLPVVDPDPNELDYQQVDHAEEYLRHALQQRRDISKRYLNDWNFDRLALFRIGAKMSSFYPLWRTATCGQLEKLLNQDYPLTNLPLVMRRTDDGREMQGIINQAEGLDPTLRLSIINDFDHPMLMDNMRSLVDLNNYIDRNFHFVGVVTRQHRPETGPGVFHNLLAARSDAQTFSQVMLFIPRPRKVLGDRSARGNGVVSLGGTLGYTAEIGMGASPGAGGRPANIFDEIWFVEGWPTNVDLFNQNWMVQLVPATTKNMPQILTANPGGSMSAFRMPNYANLPSRTLKQVSHH
jgi:hypothetical protein